jgi:sugar lactone lactonase YvrE
MRSFGMRCGLLGAAAGLAVMLMPTPTAAAATTASVPVHTVITFLPDRGEYPEGIAVDRRGASYVGIAGTGEVRRFAPDGAQRSVTTLPIGTSGGFLLGLATPRPGVLYVADNSHEAATHGIWEVVDRPGGATARLLAPLPPEGQPNGVATDAAGNVFVGDSLLGVVWRITPAGRVQRWSDDALLAPSTVFGIGANGVLVHDGALYVANTDLGTIVRIPIRPDGTAGHAARWAADPLLVGADDIAFDARGNLYVSSFSANTLNRVGRDGRVTVLADAADGLDYPAGIEFGGSPADCTTLYIVDVGGNFNQPKLQAARIGIPGAAG